MSVCESPAFRPRMSVQTGVEGFETRPFLRVTREHPVTHGSAARSLGFRSRVGVGEGCEDPVFQIDSVGDFLGKKLTACVRLTGFSRHLMDFFFSLAFLLVGKSARLCDACSTCYVRI